MRNYFSSEALQEPAARNFFFAPLMGLMFLMFLPFIGFYLTVQALGIKLVDVTKSFSGSPAVGNAYLTGAAPDASMSEVAEPLLDIENEVIARRKK